MTLYSFGTPYLVKKREAVPESYEMVHAEKYELVYNFESRYPLSLRQAREIYASICSDPRVKENTKIKYVGIETLPGSPEKGKIVVQFESAHPGIPLALIIAAVVAAILIAAAIAAILFIVPPAIAASYKLTTAIMRLPDWLSLIVIPLFAGAVIYVGAKIYRTVRGKS